MAAMETAQEVAEEEEEERLRPIFPCLRRISTKGQVSKINNRTISGHLSKAIGALQISHETTTMPDMAALIATIKAVVVPVAVAAILETVNVSHASIVICVYPFQNVLLSWTWSLTNILYALF